MVILKRSFYTRPTLKVAQGLLGCFLVRRIGKKKLIGKIVETEAYIGPGDKASHAYQGKITKRNRAEFLIGGHVYIYLVYGMYYQLNITTSKEGRPECILIRALEPINDSKAKIKKSASGPGKLCQYLKLDKSFYGEDLCKSKRLWLENKKERISLSQIVHSKRIGIDYAQEYKDKLWRFYLRDNEFVSRK